MKRYVIGDIHGRINALNQCFERSKFDYNKDLLIVLGDVCDGGYNTYTVVEELLKIKNLVFCLGNHDQWFMDHIASGWAEKIWLHQGGNNTLKSYGAIEHKNLNISIRKFLDTRGVNVPVTHQEFFNNHVLYYELDGMLFVHGGFDIRYPITEQKKEVLLWDRELIWDARAREIRRYKKIFVGHTTTQLMNKMHDIVEPIHYHNLIMMDTGAGWNGKLSIMDIDTEEFWQSERQKPAK